MRTRDPAAPLPRRTPARPFTWTLHEQAPRRSPQAHDAALDGCGCDASCGGAPLPAPAARNALRVHRR